MTKRMQILARIDPELRKAAARVVKRQKTTLNALIEAALRAYVDGVANGSAPTAATKASR
jgi:predicted HicB family RNase H-like nuclease